MASLPKASPSPLPGPSEKERDLPDLVFSGPWKSRAVIIEKRWNHLERKAERELPVQPSELEKVHHKINPRSIGSQPTVRTKDPSTSPDVGK